MTETVGGAAGVDADVKSCVLIDSSKPTFSCVMVLKPLNQGDGEYLLHLFKKDNPDLIYDPGQNYTPNWFIRFCFRVFFNCYWIKREK